MIPPSHPYTGPCIVLTVREGLALLAGATPDPDAYAAAVVKIRTANASDPRWKLPTR